MHACDPFDVTIEAAPDEHYDLDEDQWDDPRFDYWSFDRLMDEREHDFHIRIRVVDPHVLVPHVLTRCQRLLARRNAASAAATFDAVLALHRNIHDRSKPLVLADYDHSRDVWQWVLRLDAGAPFEVQAAALFHDVERLESEALSRIEHESADYQAFKQGHAGRGAVIVSTLLRSIGLSADTVEGVAGLVRNHEIRSDEMDRMLLNEADALSFFSFNSPGFFDYFDRRHCRRKVEYTLDRLGARGRAVLPTLHLRKDVAEMIAACGGF